MFSGTSDNFCELLKFSGKIFKLSEKVPEVTGELPAEFFSCRISLPAAEKSLNSTMEVSPKKFLWKNVVLQVY